jgi:hypothetical protein
LEDRAIVDRQLDALRQRQFKGRRGADLDSLPEALQALPLLG